MRHCKRCRLVTVRLLLPLLAIVPCGQAGAAYGPAVAPATDPAPPSKRMPPETHPAGEWVRVLRDARGQPQALQTAIVRYAPRQGDRRDVTVDLIAAVHVADSAYYAGLNRRFEIYDALLYELVAPPGTTVPKGRGPSSGHPVGAVQNLFKSLLELEHQLAHIDYTKGNFVHADMSPDELSRSMADRDESLSRLVFQLLGRSIAQQRKMQAQGRSPDIDLLAALFNKNRAVRLKTVLAEQFEEMEFLLVGLGGPGGSTLIEGRNAVAMKVLDQQVRRGKKTLGIFYGAGHLSDMDRRLRETLRLEPVETLWVTAWDLSEAAETGD